MKKCVAKKLKLMTHGVMILSLVLQVRNPLAITKKRAILRTLIFK